MNIKELIGSNRINLIKQTQDQEGKGSKGLFQKSNSFAKKNQNVTILQPLLYQPRRSYLHSKCFQSSICKQEAMIAELQRKKINYII